MLTASRSQSFALTEGTSFLFTTILSPISEYSFATGWVARGVLLLFFYLDYPGHDLQKLASSDASRESDQFLRIFAPPERSEPAGLATAGSRFFRLCGGLP